MSRAPASNPPSPTAASALWGATLPIPAGPVTGDDFEARVEAAWRHLKAAYFAVEEYGRLREVLAARIEAESVAGARRIANASTSKRSSDPPETEPDISLITSQDPNRGSFTK